MAILTLVLSRHELRTDEIASRFRSIRPGISQHFRVLTKAGLLFEETPGDEQTLQSATRRLRRATGFSGQFLGGALIAIEAGSGS